MTVDNFSKCRNNYYKMRSSVWVTEIMKFIPHRCKNVKIVDIFAESLYPYKGLQIIVNIAGNGNDNFNTQIYVLMISERMIPRIGLVLNRLI